MDQLDRHATKGIEPDSPADGRAQVHRLSTENPLEPLPGSSAQPGDLIFFQRAGMVQRLVTWADDVWRHVGIVVDVGGHLWIVEAGRQGYRGRPLSTALKTYSASSICRLEPCATGCARQLVEAALEAMDKPTTYPDRYELALAGMLSLARRNKRSNAGRRGSLARTAAGRYLDRHRDDDPRTLCAALVVRSLGQVCSQHARFPNLSAAKAESTDLAFPDRLAGHFALPDDIWRLFDPSQQYRLENDLDGQVSQTSTGGRFRMRTVTAR